MQKYQVKTFVYIFWLGNGKYTEINDNIIWSYSRKVKYQFICVVLGDWIMEVYCSLYFISF